MRTPRCTEHRTLILLDRTLYSVWWITAVRFPLFFLTDGTQTPEEPRYLQILSTSLLLSSGELLIQAVKEQTLGCSSPRATVWVINTPPLYLRPPVTLSLFLLSVLTWPLTAWLTAAASGSLMMRSNVRLRRVSRPATLVTQHVKQSGGKKKGERGLKYRLNSQHSLNA